MADFSLEFLTELAQAYARLAKTFDVPQLREQFAVYNRRRTEDIVKELSGYDHDPDFNGQLYRAKRVLDAAETADLPLFHDAFSIEECDWFISFVNPPQPAVNLTIDPYKPTESDILHTDSAQKVPMIPRGGISIGCVPKEYANTVRYEDVVRIDFENFPWHRQREADEGYNRTLFTKLFESLQAMLH